MRWSIHRSEAANIAQQHGFVRRFVEFAHDFLNQDVDETLLAPNIDRGYASHRRQVVGELEQTGAIKLRACRQHHRPLRDPVFPGKLAAIINTRLASFVAA